jgi:hypothetical protein
MTSCWRRLRRRQHEGEDRLRDGKAGGNGRADHAGPAAVETCGGGWHVADVGRLVAETSAKGALASPDSLCHHTTRSRAMVGAGTTADESLTYDMKRA